MKVTRIRILIAAFAVLFAALPALAQGPVPFPPGLAKKLAARASNYSEVTLDKHMLNFASKFMNKDDKNDQQAKQIIQNLNAVYVRTYDFDKPGQYTEADLERIRSHFQGPEWQPMVKSVTKSNHQTSEIYMKVVNGKTEGMFILNAAPKELNFVYLSGNLSAKELSHLGGNFGIPKLHTRQQADKGHDKGQHNGHSTGGQR